MEVDGSVGVEPVVQLYDDIVSLGYLECRAWELAIHKYHISLHTIGSSPTP